MKIDQSVLKHYASIYWELSKPKILVMQLVTVSIGFFLANKSLMPFSAYCFLLIGTAFVSAGAGALNHYIEREPDAKMERTKNRPLPTGAIQPSSALIFGLITAVIGVGILVLKVNLLTAFLAELTLGLYILIYTPMKRLSWLNTLIGAVPGALPPLGGWAAATGGLELPAFILFFILFCWQMPHFYAIAIMYCEDYRLAGFQMLPVIDPELKRTNVQIMTYSILMLYFSVLLWMMGYAGIIYLIGAAIIGAGFVVMAFITVRRKTLDSARLLLKTSVIYLPLLLLLLIFDVLLKGLFG